MTKIWKDPNGNTVPVKFVPAIDKKKTRLIEKKFKQAKALEEKLAKFKEELLSDSDQLFEEWKLEATGKKLGEKGNYTLTSFDGKQQIEVQVQSKIEFDENITFAKEKIDEFINKKIDGADKDLAVIAAHAFKTSRGKLDTKNVLQLLSYNIKAPLWLEAMELIKKAIKKGSSRRYVRLFEKDENGNRNAVNLNFASL